MIGSSFIPVYLLCCLGENGASYIHLRGKVKANVVTHFLDLSISLLVLVVVAEVKN